MFTSPNAIDPFQIERAMPRQCAGNGPGFGGKLEGSERATASEPRERSEPSKRRACERVGGSGGERPPIEKGAKVAEMAAEPAFGGGRATANGGRCPSCALSGAVSRP